MASRPSNVGILAMEAYFPTCFVDQTALEAQDGCAGKYTKGLGQNRLAFVTDREDIASVLMTAVQRLLERFGVDPAHVGRLEVGTESLIDKSKSVKTSLMRLFGENKDIEGVTSTNACYGGTAALLNSVAWVQSEDWDGRLAICVAGDIAVYEAGPARPTSGCGAVAMLIGPDAPLALEPGLRASHVIDCYDFYKPHHSEYPMVDGKLSQAAYLGCVDACYRGYKAKAARRGEKVTVDSFDYVCMHSPYHKLVQKGFARFLYMDFLDDPTQEGFSEVQHLSGDKVDYNASLESREVDAAFREVSASSYREKILPSSFVSKEVGNCYTGAVFMNLLSLISDVGPGMVGKRVGMFSYGSGSVSSLYSFRGRIPDTPSEFTLERIQAIGVRGRLAERKSCTSEEFAQAMNFREAAYGQAPHQPQGSVEDVPVGAFFLESVNEKHHRSYGRK